MNDFQNEIWKDIKDFEGIYQVSNLGRVRSLDRIIERNNRLTHLHGKILNTRIKNNGYTIITVSVDSSRKTLHVHRLVADAFISNPKNKLTVNHVDGDKTNNHVSNLEWNTYSENLEHARQTKLNKNIIAEHGLKGEQHHSCVLNENIVRDSRILKDEGWSVKQISSFYEIKPHIFRRLFSGKTWKHII